MNNPGCGIRRRTLRRAITLLAASIGVVALLDGGDRRVAACGPCLGNDATIIRTADAIFRGEVRRVQRVVDHSGAYDVFTVVVDGGWKGTYQPVMEVLTDPHGCWSADIEVGKEYIFAPKERISEFGRVSTRIGGLYMASICSTFSDARASAIVGTLGPVSPLGRVCPQIEGRAPAEVVSRTIRRPLIARGWGERARADMTVSPFNGWRAWLSLANRSRVYDPSNPLVWKAGCY